MQERSLGEDVLSPATDHLGLPPAQDIRHFHMQGHRPMQGEDRLYLEDHQHEHGWPLVSKTMVGGI